MLSPDRSLTALVDEAVRRGADALGVAGGDGTLAVVAAAAYAHELPFICVPAGTRNHFALDLGVDRSDLVGALDAFTDAVERRIDVAEVNGRVFLNNVSLGIYGDAVRQAAYRDAKAQTLFETASKVLGPSAKAPALTLTDDLGHEHTGPAVVLVSNNPYAIAQPLVAATRPSLSRGLLGVVVLDRPGENMGPSRQSLERSRPAGGGGRAGPRRGRRRGRRPASAPAVHHATGGAARPDLAAPPRGLAVGSVDLGPPGRGRDDAIGEQLTLRQSTGSTPLQRWAMRIRRLTLMELPDERGRPSGRRPESRRWVTR